MWTTGVERIYLFFPGVTTSRHKNRVEGVREGGKKGVEEGGRGVRVRELQCAIHMCKN